MQNSHTTYEQIRTKIVTLDYSPGDHLDEKSIVTELGVSRTPVREALIRLAGEGLVKMAKNRGASVAELDLESLHAVFEAADLIERAIVRLACVRRSKADLAAIEKAMQECERAFNALSVSQMVLSNIEFHIAVAQASHNKYFIKSYRQILSDQERIAQYWYSNNIATDAVEANTLALEQHRQLINAIAAQDQQLAEDTLVEHASLCKNAVYDLISAGQTILKSVNVQANADIVTA